MKLTLEHIGYLTDNIQQTAAAFQSLGYQADPVVDDDTQQTRICFLRKKGETPIELVEPYEGNKSMQKMLKRGVGPYHTCYTVDDIDAAYEEMLDQDYRPLFKPVAAPAFGNRRICYFWKMETGFIELVNA